MLNQLLKNIEKKYSLVEAVELLKIDINVKVEIAKQVEMGTFSLCYEEDVFQFEKGMTFEEWANK